MLLIIKPMEKTIQKDVKNPLVPEETVASMLERGQVYEALEATEHERRWKDGVCDCCNIYGTNVRKTYRKTKNML